MTDYVSPLPFGLFVIPPRRIPAPRAVARPTLTIEVRGDRLLHPISEGGNPILKHDHMPRLRIECRRNGMRCGRLSRSGNRRVCCQQGLPEEH